MSIMSKICPLFYTSAAFETEQGAKCRGEDCAWYTGTQCAIVALVPQEKVERCGDISVIKTTMEEIAASEVYVIETPSPPIPICPRPPTPPPTRVLRESEQPKVEPSLSILEQYKKYVTKRGF